MLCGGKSERIAPLKLELDIVACQQFLLSIMRRVIFYIICVCLVGCDRNKEPAYHPQVPSASHEVFLGEFEVTSGRLIVSDPSYDLHTVQRQSGIDDRALSRRWKATIIVREFTGPTDRRVGVLVARHESVHSLDELEWKEVPGSIGVDTGMVVVCDKSRFHDQSIVPQGQKFSFGESRNEPALADDLWYSYCCELTRPPKVGAAFAGGVVSNAGWGDGAYAGFVARDKEGVLVAVRVEFIDEKGR